MDGPRVGSVIGQTELYAVVLASNPVDQVRGGQSFFFSHAS